MWTSRADDRCKQLTRFTLLYPCRFFAKRIGARFAALLRLRAPAELLCTPIMMLPAWLTGQAISQCVHITIDHNALLTPTGRNSNAPRRPRSM